MRNDVDTTAEPGAGGRSQNAPRAAIVGIGGAIPDLQLSCEEWVDVAVSLAPSDVPRHLLQHIAEDTQIQRRGCAAIAQEILALVHQPGADPRGPSTYERVQEWGRSSRPLAAKAARAALEDAGISADRITHVVTASCTGMQSPGPDQWLIWDLGLSPTCRRTNVGFMGCHSAFNALAVADSFARSDPGAVVLVVNAEISTVHIQFGSRIDRLMANALFADGASAAIVTCAAPDNAPRIGLAGTAVFPSTEAETGWVIGNNGFEMTISSSAAGHLRREIGPWINGLLARAGLTIAQVGGWAIHVGSPRIIEEVTQPLNLPAGALEPSFSVLRDHGNMSSATILFILRRLRDAGIPKPWVAMSFGAGMAGEALLFVDADAPQR